MYNLIIVWYTGENETHTYKTREAAEQAERNYKTAFGNQVTWTGITRA